MAVAPARDLDPETASRSVGKPSCRVNKSPRLKGPGAFFGLSKTSISAGA